MTSPIDSTPKPVVLLVDDEAEICNVLELGLRNECDIESARSAKYKSADQVRTGTVHSAPARAKVANRMEHTAMDESEFSKF